MIRLLCVPYDLGRQGVRMGAGPERLLAAGAAEKVRSRGHDVAIERVALSEPFEHEIGAYFALQSVMADHVAQAVGDGEFPFVLGGNCGCVLGVVTGLGLGQRGGVVWFDAHGDLNTPETTVSGFLDGMPLAVLTGHCWRTLAEGSLHLPVLPADRVLLAGARSMDSGERDLLRSTRLPFVGPDGLGAVGSDFARELTALRQRVASVHVHVDLDVIDSSQGRANQFAAPDGPSIETVVEAIRFIGEQIPVNSVSLTSYDPACDEDGRALGAAMRLLEALAGLPGPSETGAESNGGSPASGQ
jgi:arginase